MTVGICQLVRVLSPLTQTIETALMTAASFRMLYPQTDLLLMIPSGELPLIQGDLPLIQGDLPLIQANLLYIQGDFPPPPRYH